MNRQRALRRVRRRLRRVQRRVERIASRRQTHQAAWAVLGAVTAIGAGILVRKGLEQGWEAYHHEPPPKHPGSLDTTWPQALIWGGVTGMFVGLARLVGRRGAASGWRRLTGRMPPI